MSAQSKCRFAMICLALTLFCTHNVRAGLIAWYRFDETDPSSPAKDSSGNGLDGIYQGGSAFVSGKFGNALQAGLPDANDVRGFVRVPGNAKLSVPNFTVMFWMLGTTDFNTGYAMPIARGTGDAANTWRVQINPPSSDPTAPRGLGWVVAGQLHYVGKADR